MRNPIDIRRLRPGEAALAKALNGLFAVAFDDPQSYGTAPPDTYLEGLLAKPHISVLVALDADTVIGGLVAYELEKLEQARSEIYIYDLAVAETHRRRGVATGLIRALQEIAADRGAWVIFVQGDYGDDAALALYDKLGVREEVLHFDIPVPDRPAIDPT
jgi:aminoglycoside 3-N-acetyltransferase I